MKEERLREILEFAIDSARHAGIVTLGYFGADPAVDLKDDGTPVTAADREAETVLRRRIEAAFPRDGIVGEEFGESPGSSAARWIIDPIDGTQSFIHGVPLYAVLIGYEHEGEPLAGVIHLPALGETIWAGHGLGCYRNGTRARVSETASLERATVLGPGLRTLAACGRLQAFQRLCMRVAVDRSWCDAYGYALVATGRADVMLDPSVSLWDVAPVTPIVREAGGSITDWSGNPTHLAGEAIATNGHVLDELCSALRGETGDRSMPDSD